MTLSEEEKDKVEMMFKFMEYDDLNDWEDNFVASVGEQYERKNDLTRGQFEKLEEVFHRVSGGS